MERKVGERFSSPYTRAPDERLKKPLQQEPQALIEMEDFSNKGGVKEGIASEFVDSSPPEFFSDTTIRGMPRQISFDNTNTMPHPSESESTHSGEHKLTAADVQNIASLVINDKEWQEVSKPGIGDRLKDLWNSTSFGEKVKQVALTVGGVAGALGLAAIGLAPIAAVVLLYTLGSQGYKAFGSVK